PSDTGAATSAAGPSGGPSSWTWARPSATARTRPGAPPGRYTAYGEYAPGDPPTSSASATASTRPGRAHRCTGAGSLSAASARAVCDSTAPPDRSSPSASANARTIHAGWLWTTARWPTGSTSAAGATSAIQSSRDRPATRRSTALAKPVAAGWIRWTRSTVDETAAWAGTRVNSAW